MEKEKLIEKIKYSARNEKTPETLMPENVIEKLPEKEKKRPFGQVYKWGTVAAAVLVVIIGVVLAGNYLGSRVDKIDTSIAPAESMDISGSEQKSVALPDAAAGVPESAEEIQEEGQEALNGVLAQAGSYEEIYEKLKNNHDTQKSDESDGATESTGEESGGFESDSGAGYSGTNIQEMGVDEGDIVKTDGAYIYILKNDAAVQILRAEGAQVENVSLIETLSGGSETARDMYVSGDRLVLISARSQADITNAAEDVSMVQTSQETVIYTYDISDRTNPKKMGAVTQEGEYAGSRLVDGYLYTYTQCYKYSDFRLDSVSGREDALIPSVDGSMLEPGQIYIPKDVDYSSYLVFSSVNLEKPGQVCDKKAVISMSQTFYVSTGSIYMTGNGNQGSTTIVKLDFEKGTILPSAAGVVRGYLNDNFSMSEYEGYLRVATTSFEESGSLNHLYVLDENMNIAGRIENLAKGETIRSVRFLENTGYFVTYRNIDPLFSIDLSEPENPKILGELKITGFSEYLHFYGENRLFGLGYESDPETGEVTGLKLSMYDISDPKNVRELHKAILDLDGSTALTNYRALLIEPERNVIGFAGEKWNFSEEEGVNLSYTCDYFVYSYDESRGFVSQAAMERGEENGSDARGIYLGNTFYLVETSQSKIKIYDMNNQYRFIKEIDL